jgi:hypothetical protein
MRSVTFAAGLLALALAISGCVQQPPPVVPSSTPTVAPVFATDADALAAAKTAFVGGVVASDAIEHEGGKNPSRLSGWETVNPYSSDSKVFEAMAASGEYTKGSTTFTTFELETVGDDRAGRVTIAAHVCLDTSKVQLFGRSNRPIPDASAPIVPLVVTFQNVKIMSRNLKLERSETWDGKDVCP